MLFTAVVIGGLAFQAEPSLEDVRAWARACLSVPGVRTEWRVESPLWTSAAGTELAGKYYHAHTTEYRWPDCMTRDVMALETTGGLRSRPDRDFSEVISPDGIRTYWSMPERRDEPPRKAWLSDKATRECFSASFLLGCWLANQPDRLDALTVERQSASEIVVRIATPPQLVTFKGENANSLGMSKIEVIGGSTGEVLFAYEFDDLRSVPGLPGRQGFQRRLFSKAMSAEGRNDNLDQLISVTVHPRLDDSTFQPGQTMIAHRYPGIVPPTPLLPLPTSSESKKPPAKEFPTPPRPSSAPPSNAPIWLWWGGTACAVVGIGWLVRRRLAA